jgi:hypothetical protein
VVLATAFAFSSCGSSSANGTGTSSNSAKPDAAKPAAFVRVNQVGYVEGDPKQARLLSPVGARGAPFQVIDAGGGVVLSGRAGAERGRWNASFRHVYGLDLSALHSSGVYSIVVEGPVSARSPTFKVASAADLYSGLAASAIRFLRAQRDGPQVDSSILGRQPSHLQDSKATVYATPSYRHDRLKGRLEALGGSVDVQGGWMDAGDTLKYAETASFTEVALLYSLRGDPPALGSALQAGRDEARFGLQWLLSIWRPSPRRLIYQVGLGNGNSKVLGAHDTTWGLPQRDDALEGTAGSQSHFVKYRPAFRDGPPRAGTSPNLAGRMAAAFALGAQVFAHDDPALAKRSLEAARTIFASARTRHVGRLTTATPHSFYPEQEWRDDMELGAAELSLAQHGSVRYLRKAANWANAYAASPLNGTDTFNLYDVAALAHSELDRAMVAAHVVGDQISGVSWDSLAPDLVGQLRLAHRAAAHDPFGLGARYRDDDTVTHALGLAIESRMYDGLVKKPRFAAFGRTQRDFVLGDNAWGTSFVVGAGSRFPRCLHSPIANLQGSLDASPPVMQGAVVPGPVNPRDLEGLSLPSGFRPCPVGGGDPFRRFDGFGARYVDNVVSSPTSEPSLDTAALGLMAFAQASGR